jgi:anti-sigma regulatory factor (Ser/Thr protein kinase)
MSPLADARFRPRRSDRISLAALVSAPGNSRRFVRQVCARWNVPDEQSETIQLLTSELVTNAVAETGILESDPEYGVAHADATLIQVGLLEFAHSLVVEVWDSSFEPPKLAEPDSDSERGRGLQLVDTLSRQWGYYPARTGKVVWCEILSLRPGPSADCLDRDPGTLRRFLEALQLLTWDEEP